MSNLNKVLIICFDGLHREPVEKYDLKNLKQKEYGDLFGTSVFSGTLWSTFQTGLPREKHRITSWNHKALSTERFFEQQGIKCIPKLFKSPKVMYFPFYNPEWKIYLGVEHDYSKSYSVNCKVFSECCKAIRKKDWDLFMTCFMLIDNLGHCGKLNRSAYYLIDEWVGTLVNLGRPDWTLIIGDKSPKHTQPGFYSSSIPLNRKRVNIEDFYQIIKEELENAS